LENGLSRNSSAIDVADVVHACAVHMSVIFRSLTGAEPVDAVTEYIPSDLD
jgi:hypothetical protein